MEIDLLVEDAHWEEVGLGDLAARATGATLAHIGIDGQAAELSLLGCDDARIAGLNADFRGKPQPTNVLSWPAEARAAARPGDIPPMPAPGPDGVIELGDIAISYETCAREAAEQGKSLTDHVAHLIVHGTLHLLGYDHENDNDAELMERLEREILGKMGVDDPYRD